MDAETLNQYIKKIVVHEDIQGECTRKFSLEIHYNFKPVDEPHKYYLNDDVEVESSPLAIYENPMIQFVSKLHI